MLRYNIRTGVRKIKTKTFVAISTIGLVLGGGGMSLAIFGSAHAVSTPPVAVYDALPNVTPATNYPSLGFQATQTTEFGDYIHLGGSARTLNTVTVTMSDWALHSDYLSLPDAGWTHDITINVYSVNSGTPNTFGTLLGTVTNNTFIPWRPVSDNCGGDPTAWTDSHGNCNHGLAFNATFDLSNLNVTLPDDVIVSVAFNTQSYGTQPEGNPGPYNSLNVAVPDNQKVSVGSDNNANAVFWSSITGTSGSFVENSGWAPNGTVAFRITATQGRGNSTPGLDRYLNNPGRQQATEVGAQCGSGAGSGAFGYFGRDNNLAGGADGQQTGLNNSALCGNRQGNLLPN